MPINQLVQYCHNQYKLKTTQCLDCPNKAQESCQSNNCSICFSDMFFKNCGRTFNCECSTFSYVCRYIYQYSSEILHLLRYIQPIFKKDDILNYDEFNIMSIGCGPCSEAFAFDTFIKEIEFNNAQVTFTAFDTNVIWNNVQNKAKEVLLFSTNIISQNCFNYIEQNNDFVFPNILIMNYLFSDITKHGDLNQFINDVTEKIIDKMPPKSIIIVNDINCQNPRDFYNVLFQKTNTNNNVSMLSCSFSGYNYGTRYFRNSVEFSLKEKSIELLQSIYGTRIVCTSAQLLIYKKSNKI